MPYYWKAYSFLNKKTFCKGNTAVVNIDEEIFLAIYGELIAKIDKNDHVHIKHGGLINITTRNYLAEIINILKYPFTIKFKNPDLLNKGKITLTYKYPKNNKPPVKERRTHEINDVWTNLYQLTIDIKHDITINNTTDNNNTTNNTQLTNALTKSLNTIPN